MNDVMLAPDETPSGLLRAVANYRKRDLSQGPCPVGIRQLTPAEWLAGSRADALVVEVQP